MAYSDILYGVDESVATITLNRPDRLNAWSRDMEGDVRSAMDVAGADKNVRVIIVTGAGRGFCAGADMSMLSASSEEDSDSRRESDRHRLHHEPMTRQLDLVSDHNMRYTYFTSVPKPVIAAINGPCAGLGLVMALFCDVRCASENAVFTTAFARRGLIAEHGIDWILPRVVGLPNALDLLLSARKLGAEEARDMGLVGKVFPHDELMGAVRSYAKELATMVSPRSMRVMKEQIYRTQDTSLSESVNRGFDEMYDSLDSDDFKEGVAHFVEKRDPSFNSQ
ncbi:MAG: enoyl-CoA hydratase [Alphaproteobacteria bacterium]|jgi:enoyl-CoA hydratase/carnithine racemase|nr:enoyl-CoA hydratase [Alphaproteobacteria bacterium]HIB18111.1 enoyl-CoA hydratase [Alphaproteobacteria bacterium]HIB57004.1 enoyl-CoA hydratase [Alphaproteobacteria bacterium]HIO02017.1 enoyl-CoA hydratase [Alphaproteobacteria bacterium]